MAKRIVEQLDPIFKAGSIAVIGASKTPPKWGFQMVDSPLKSGFRGPIYPVNPKEKKIGGLPCYPSVRDIPYDIDMAVMAVPAAVIPRAMAECAEKGVKGAVLITAGFAETGEEGKALEDEVVKIAREGGRDPGCYSQEIWQACHHPQVENR
jgi:acetyltransferase